MPRPKRQGNHQNEKLDEKYSKQQFMRRVTRMGYCPFCTCQKCIIAQNYWSEKVAYQVKYNQKVEVDSRYFIGVCDDCAAVACNNTCMSAIKLNKLKLEVERLQKQVNEKQFSAFHGME